MKEFIYILKPIERLTKEENWTEFEEKLVSEHFNYLKELLEKGRLVIAGKTDGLDEKTFGIVIYYANDEKEAKEIMQNDPAVKNGIFLAELYTYTVALIKK